ncbi:MAG: 1-acyl-sn-glycerol-3-phosphate acyltransferase [Pirellulales bacterium]
MNPYRMALPPRAWEARLKPRLVRLLRFFRRWKRGRDQRLIQVDVLHRERLADLLRQDCGVLITPNHSTHADPFTMYDVADQVGRPFYFMSTWHVFEAQSRIGQRMLQWHGVFSVDREGNDLRAFKQAVHILQTERHPLVIFPEGEVYHCNDQVTPFRDGPAAMALAAARRAKRPVMCVPVAFKYRYLDDPMPELLEVMDLLEREVFWRPRRERPLVERIYALAEALLVLKELEFLGAAANGPVVERLRGLAEHVLASAEQRCGITAAAGTTIPERVKGVRRTALEKREPLDGHDPQRVELQNVLDDAFFVVQLFSYPGNYLTEQSSVERLAETLDKLEEDVLGKYSATIRSRRAVTVSIGQPINVPSEKGTKNAVGELTETLERSVQGLLDEMNGEAHES